MREKLQVAFRTDNATKKEEVAGFSIIEPKQWSIIEISRLVRGQLFDPTPKEIICHQGGKPPAPISQRSLEETRKMPSFQQESFIDLLAQEIKKSESVIVRRVPKKI